MHIIERLEERRLLAAGDLDRTFAFDGRIGRDLFSSFSSTSSVVAAGDDQFLVYTDEGLLKIDSQGQSVDSFGESGHASVAAQIEQAIVLPDDRIIVFTDALRRLNPDGTLDTSFGQDGVVELNHLITNSGFLQQIIVQSDGKIVVLFWKSETEGSTARFNADGSRDDTFGDFGFSILENTNEIVMTRMADDTLIIGGIIGLEGDENVGLIGLTADGALATSFGSGGTVSREIVGEPERIVEIPGGGGSFLVISSDGGVRKLSANGTHDTSFQTPGGDGVSRPALSWSIEKGILPTDDGKFMVFSRAGMARLNADGTVDPSFTRVFNDFSFPSFEGAALTSDGDIVVMMQDPFRRSAAELLKIQGSGSTPGPIALTGSTLTFTGSDEFEFFVVAVGPVGGSIQVLSSVELGRLYELDDVDFVSASGGGADDVLYIDGVALRSSMSGGEGSDTLVGGTLDDSLSGNAGYDILWGGQGNDRLAGNGGRDRLDGSVGNDNLFGGAGADWLYADSGNDILRGDGGNDLITSPFSVISGGTDTISGGDGDDTIVAGDGNAESIFGDAGSDTATADEDDILAGVEVTT